MVACISLPAHLRCAGVGPVWFRWSCPETEVSGSHFRGLLSQLRSRQNGKLRPMRTIPTRAWLLVILSAGLQVLMFPTGGPMPTWRAALCWIALVPFLVALSLPGKDGAPLSLRSSLLLGYLCGFLWYFGNCFWIYQTMYLYGGLPKPVSFGIVILFSLYLGLYHALFAGFFSALRRGRKGAATALVLTPFLWVAVELARARITGFPWDLLGNSLVSNLVVTRIAPLTGVMGISFLVAGINAGLGAGLISKGKRGKQVCVLSGVLAVCFQLSGVWAGSRISFFQPDQLAVMMQENLSVGATGRSVRPLSVEEELVLFTAATVSPTIDLYPLETLTPLSLQRDFTLAHKGGEIKSSVLIWPEAPSRFESGDPLFRERVGELAHSLRTPMIAGSLGVDPDPASPRGYYLYDSASLFDAAGTYRGRYDKIHLVPWGEYIPFKRFFSFAQKLTAGAGDMDPGTDRTLFRTGGHTYGIFICYESIFGDEVRQFVKNGAEVLVNISDDGWYGETGAPWQHLNMARMRAIENHRWVLRSTNTGVTTNIDPLGRVVSEAPRHVRGAFGFPFSFEQGTTFYTRHGDWLAYLCALVTVLATGARWRFSGSFVAGRVK